MNLRRTVTILGIAAFGTAASLGTAHAAPAESNWGVHADGWNAELRNFTGHKVELMAHPLGNLTKASKDINPLG
ncbi:hypothetical protein LQL77_07195 [Rhodococcus cerastii]|nr:hypothetical protein [Rhodococcus cerastii]